MTSQVDIEVDLDLDLDDETVSEAVLTAAQRLPLREAKALGRALDDDALDGLAASAQRRARVIAAEFLFELGP